MRDATHVLYGFFRIADEVVDDADGVPPDEQVARLEELRAQAVGDAESDDPVLVAFDELRRRYAIPESEIHAFIDAMKADVHTNRYETYADLETYMRGSAAAVGVMMTAIMEPDDPDLARPHAVALGEAFQLTNFIRDVREDVEDRGRIYLPLSTLEEHGVPVERVERLDPSPGLERAVEAELERAERLYREGVAGIRHLPADCQLPVLLAAVLYAEHHRVIRAQGYDVVSREPSLSRLRKGSCLLRTRWRWQWNRDPEAVFRRVSAVPAAGTGAAGTDPDRGPGEGVPTR